MEPVVFSNNFSDLINFVIFLITDIISDKFSISCLYI